MTLFDKAEMRVICKDLSDFCLPYAVLLFDFLNNVLKPNKADNFQRYFLVRTIRRRQYFCPSDQR